MSAPSFSGHEEFAESLAAYSLDALDSTAERATLEAHLRECSDCQQTLAGLRATTEAIGRAVTAVPLPAALKSKVMDYAREHPNHYDSRRLRTADPAVVAHSHAKQSSFVTSTSLAWLTAAAAVMVAVGSLLYAMALQRQVLALTDVAASAAARAEALTTEVASLRRQSTELIQVLNVIGAPDVRQASLIGQGAAAGALGRAYWSRTEGLVFKALRLPPLTTGRDYQLWIVPPTGAPVSMGMLAVRADGSSSQATPLADLPAAAAVAVTIEPAGGSPTPTMPIVMVGNLAG
ncbi:MAG: anti-sigma factor [Vicinamibacterales bacterium]